MNTWLTETWGAEAVLVAMAFAWGATLGSFINVVLHRVPRGESVVTHGSRCPACGSPIRPRDNVPILGWLLLGGRCRDCGAAISAGYPAVEATCGVLAAVVAAGELAGTGSPLLAASRPGIDRLLAGDARLALAWAMHTVIPVSMLAWSLAPVAGGDGHEASRHRPDDSRAAAWLVAVTIALVTAVPAIGPPGFTLTGDVPPGMSGWRAAFIAACLGAAAGRLAATMTGLPGDRKGLATCGAAAGWQAVVVVTILTAAIRLLVAMVLPAGRAARVAAAAAGAVAAAAVFAVWSPVARAWACGWGFLPLG